MLNIITRTGENITKTIYTEHFLPSAIDIIKISLRIESRIHKDEWSMAQEKTTKNKLFHLKLCQLRYRFLIFRAVLLLHGFVVFFFLPSGVCMFAPRKT